MKVLLGFLIVLNVALVLGATVRLAGANEKTAPLVPVTLVKGRTADARPLAEEKSPVEKLTEKLSIPAPPAAEEADSLEKAAEITDNRELDLDEAKKKIGVIGSK